MSSPQFGILLALCGLMLGAAIAFGLGAVLLRRQLRAIGTLPDLHKKLRAREVQLSMMRTTVEERRNQIRQLLDELELQSEETITARLLHDLALESLSEIEERLPHSLREEHEEELAVRNHRRPRKEFSSMDEISRRLEMIGRFRRELGLPTDSATLPFPTNVDREHRQGEKVPVSSETDRSGVVTGGTG